MKIRVRDPVYFKKLLLVKGYSQRGLARSVKISEPYANQIVTGARNPGPEIAKRIVDLLEVKFEDIFFVDDDSKSDLSSA